MSLDPDRLDASENDDPEAWCVPSSAYGGREANLGTPGSANDACPVDSDGDGYTTLDDCDDSDAAVHPGADETWYDGVDADCDGGSDYDADADGYESDDYAGEDCDDTSARVRPDAYDVPEDGVDGDCDGSDATGDPVLDIDDLAAGDLVVDEVMFWPAHASETAAWFEIYNASGEDVYLDGLVIEHEFGTYTVWDDLVVEAGDYAVFCADADPRTNGGVTVDHQLTERMWGEYFFMLSLQTDAVTVDEVVFDEGAMETWGASVSLRTDSLDSVSNDDMSNWCTAYTSYGRGDYGTPGDENECPADDDEDGYDTSTDCDDSDATVHPGADEAWYDGVDSDCDGASDYDADGDGYDAEDYGGEDCDDTSRRVRPDAYDVPDDGVDGDCDGSDATGDTVYDLSDLGEGDLVISEIAIATLSSGEEMQWFEVYNPLDAAVYLDGLEVVLWGESVMVWDTLLIDSEDYAVFAVTDDPRMLAGVDVDFAYGWYWFGWDEGEISLVGESGTIDTVAFDSRSFPVTWGASMSLDPDALDATSNDDGGNWCEARSTYGYGDRGTPGAANDGC